MSTTITDVDELQAMEDALTEDYVLGNNIDASATSGWNGGAGFDPIGSYAWQYSYSRPDSDDSGYAGQSGSWTIYPSDGVYYDKVDEETADDDSTYIQAVTNESYVLLAHDALALEIPYDAVDISVIIRARLKNVSAGTSYVQGMVNIIGTEYLIGTNSPITSQSYALRSWKMDDYPPIGSGAGWTVDQVFSLVVAGVGVKVSDASPDVRITQLYIQVDYKLKFTGTFDGAGYTTSDLFIDRDTTDYVGLFGYAIGATITDCVLTGVDITGDDYVGGCIGYADSCAMSGCSVEGTVSGDDYIGSLVGWLYSSTISQCHGTGSVTGDDYIGGLVGGFQTCTMNNSYSRASATGDNYVGGLAAYSYSSETITNCYSTGLVTGNTNVGGLLGYSEGTITNCFWDTTTSGQATSDGGTGYATATMKLLATFYDASWDIDSTTTDRNDGYPFLSWEIDESDTIWLIYGGTRCFTIPDLVDHKGRCPKGARVRAYRVDTHEFVTEGYLDSNCNATLCGLPNDVDVVFHVTWGGPRTPRQYTHTRRGFS